MKGKLVLGDDQIPRQKKEKWIDGFECFDENGNTLTRKIVHYKFRQAYELLML